MTLSAPKRGVVRRGAVVGAFAVVCAVLAGWLYVNSGGAIPFVTREPDYRIAFRDENILNLVRYSEVHIAGAPVGRVQDIAPDRGSQRVVVGLDPGAAPLHQGATVRVGMRSLAGPSYVDIVDGRGPEIPSGAQLADNAVAPTVDVHAVLESLDPRTREALGGMVRSLGTCTKGTANDVSTLMTALGSVGKHGYTAVDAIAAQSSDIQALAKNTNTLLDALDTGQGQIADVVRNARRLTAATSGQRPAVEATMRQLPGLLASTNTASGRLSELSGSLAPIAANLRTAAPALNQALVNLPGTTADLRGLLPALNGTLDAAPATLNRVPAVGGDVRGFIPKARFELRDLNPMLSYLAPYGPDLGAFLANFGAAFAATDEHGMNYLRLMLVANEQSLKAFPFPTANVGPLTKTNAYPGPGGSAHPQPQGPAPHVERAPR